MRLDGCQSGFVDTRRGYVPMDAKQSSGRPDLRQSLRADTADWWKIILSRVLTGQLGKGEACMRLTAARDFIVGRNGPPTSEVWNRSGDR
jgi:hypothetical protein